ncbi:MAG TPA: methyltransferase domain-containing protein, partial [Lacipirellulaceae bacterium]|nr:methyltransferase domain-containing protein [Lacipirellulaceae bacterium]
MSHRRLAAGLLIVLAAAPASPPAGGQDSSPAPIAAPARRVYMGRTIAPPMQASGAAWLVRQSRDAEENPRKLLAALDLRPGQTICDFGCGNGYYTLQIADRVGPRGAVYAVDIQQEMLDELSHRAGQRGLG